jgi:DNA-binding transcriptional LysR family regulator
MLSLYKLEIFSVAVGAGSFSKAAERLFLTQSAVSQHIQDLEHHLGARLFRRGRRGVELTLAGEILKDYAANILRLVKEAENAITDVDLLTSGSVRIGATPGVDTYLLPDWVGAFQRRFPHLRISLSTGVTAQVVGEILNHMLDIGIVEGELNGESRLAQLVLRSVDQMVVVGRGHPWFNQKVIDILALADQPFIARPANSHTRQWLDNLLKLNHLELNIVAEFDNPEAIKRAVMAGVGVTILPQYVVEHELALGLLHVLSVRDENLQRTIKLVWNHDEPFNPVTRAFLTHLSSECAPLVKLLHDGAIDNPEL